MFKLRESDVIKVVEATKRGKSARVVTRAHTLNMRHKGWSIIEVSDSLELTPRTVINICTNYEQGGIEKALHDDPRTGRPLKFDDRVKSYIAALVCSDPPEGFDRWTLELLKEESESSGSVENISLETIRVILHEHDLKPWKQEMWCVPELDEEFIERMEDILDVYEMPYNPKKPVVCLDEKPVVLHGEKREPVPMSQGQARRVDYEYTRNGSANVFCAVEPKTGRYMTQVTEQRKACDFAKFLYSVARKYHNVEKIILVMDNLNTHKKKSLTDFYGEEKGNQIWERFEVHYTPKHASWLDQAEIAIGMYQRQCLGNTRIPDIETLKKKTKAWTKIINRKKVTINWKFTTNQARIKFNYT